MKVIIATIVQAKTAFSTPSDNPPGAGAGAFVTDACPVLPEGLAELAAAEGVGLETTEFVAGLETSEFD